MTEALRRTPRLAPLHESRGLNGVEVLAGWVSKLSLALVSFPAMDLPPSGSSKNIVHSILLYILTATAFREYY